MHGSVTPKLLVRTLCIGIWATFITIISQKVHPSSSSIAVVSPFLLIECVVNIHPIITTVLGILVGFSLNLRSATAYERYMDGRKVWSRLSGVSAALARDIWINVEEREGNLAKQDLLGKVTFLNMIVTFAVALKHKVRFEPYIKYEDLYDLVSHLDTFARDAGEPTIRPRQKDTLWTHLRNLVRIAEPNPRAELKRAKRPLGNLSIEILSHMASYIRTICANKTLSSSQTITDIYVQLNALNDILTTADRILNTPLPIAYTIAISQITWIYIITFPFQLVHLMGWLTIPTTIVSAYIILGFAAIGNEIENPFGQEVNDLPLELYCTQIASDIAVISARPPADMSEVVLSPENKPLYPMSRVGSGAWEGADLKDIREALLTRGMVTKPAMWRRQSCCATISKGFDHEGNGRGQSVGGSTLAEGSSVV